MIECIFTLDYEIYGNGSGSLGELVHDPCERLARIFQQFDVPFVNFVEVAELEVIENWGTDNAVRAVRRQIGEFHESGVEIALHIHPQWYNGTYSDGQWRLDANEYNLSTLPKERIAEIVNRAINYLRDVLGQKDFTPTSFRAGNWLLQPTKLVAEVLRENGIWIDSSVFKGGLQRFHKLDYRATLANGYYWRFSSDVTCPLPDGELLEIPIYTVMAPVWKLLTAKRVSLQRRSPSLTTDRREKLHRLFDLSGFRFPVKLDFCRMTLSEMTTMFDKIVSEDRADPERYKPIVAIGHTKDLVDYDAVSGLLRYLQQNKVQVVTLQQAAARISDTIRSPQEAAPLSKV